MQRIVDINHQIYTMDASNLGVVGSIASDTHDRKPDNREVNERSLYATAKRASNNNVVVDEGEEDMDSNTDGKQRKDGSADAHIHQQHVLIGVGNANMPLLFDNNPQRMNFDEEIVVENRNNYQKEAVSKESMSTSSASAILGIDIPSYEYLSSNYHQSLSNQSELCETNNDAFDDDSNNNNCNGNSNNNNNINERKRSSSLSETVNFQQSMKKQRVSDISNASLTNHVVCSILSLSDDILTEIFSYLGLPGNSAQQIVQSLSQRGFLSRANAITRNKMSRSVSSDLSSYMEHIGSTILIECRKTKILPNISDDEEEDDIGDIALRVARSGVRQHNGSNLRRILPNGKVVRHVNKRRGLQASSSKDTFDEPGRNALSVFEIGYTLQLVSKRFRDAVQTMPSFFGIRCLDINVHSVSRYEQKLDLVCNSFQSSLIHTLIFRSNTFLKDDHLIRIADALKNNLTHIDLSRCDKVSDIGLNHLFRKCTKLVYVDISTLHRVTDESVSLLGQHCKSLEELNLGSCVMISGSCFSDLIQLSHLKTLNLEYLFIPNLLPLFALLSNCPITHLNLSGLRGLDDSCPVFEIPPLNGDTNHFKKALGYSASSITNRSKKENGFLQLLRIFLHRSDKLPRLQELRVAERSDADLEILASTSLKLKVLYCHMTMATDSSLATVLESNGSELEFISFQSCVNFGKLGAEAILKHCPKLVAANLYRSTRSIPRDLYNKLMWDNKIEFSA